MRQGSRLVVARRRLLMLSRPSRSRSTRVGEAWKVAALSLAFIGRGMCRVLSAATLLLVLLMPERAAAAPPDTTSTTWMMTSGQYQFIADTQAVTVAVLIAIALLMLWTALRGSGDRG